MGHTFNEHKHNLLYVELFRVLRVAKEFERSKPNAKQRAEFNEHKKALIDGINKDIEDGIKARDAQ